MFNVSVVLFIANAAARFLGHHGAVTRQAREHRFSSQTVYNHASEVVEAIQDRFSDGPPRERLLRENQELRRENGQLWDWLNQTIEFPQAKQQEFGVRAVAMGLSLNQIVELLILLLGVKAAPGRSTVHRWVQDAARAARSSNGSTRDARPTQRRPVSTRSSSTATRFSWASSRKA